MHSHPVASTSTGIANWMQIFSGAATPAASSLLSSSAVQAQLAKASPADIVHLSDQALQLQEVDGLFGTSDPSQTAQTANTGQAMANMMTSLFAPLVPNTSAAPQTESPGLAMQNLLTSIYSPTGSAGSSSTVGSLVNLLA
jgi:hypothetical protein